MDSPNATSTFANEGQEGIVSNEEALSLSLSEDKVNHIIGKRITDGQAFWNQKLDLDNVRTRNEERWRNLNREVSNEEIYDFQPDYRDNRIFVSVETLSANTVSKIPYPEVIEAQDTDASRELAENFGKVLQRRAEDIFLKEKLQMVARHLLMGFRLGVMKTFWDTSAGQLKDGAYTGDVGANFIRPHKIILDADAEDPNDVPLIAESMTKTVEELGYQFPDKKDELFRKVGVQEGAKNVYMATKVNHYEVWFSFFDEGIKKEGVTWKYGDLVFDYGLNPHYNYGSDKTNFFDSPKKPYTLFNFMRIGRWALDDTSLTEQAASMQDILERRGRQIVENADQANATKIFNIAMIDAGDAQKYTGDPRENILTKGDVRMAFARVAPPSLPAYVFQDKIDARQEIDNIFGTHAPLRGEKTESPTLGQEVMSQRSDMGRTATLGESVEKGATGVYHQMAQLYKVFATEEHIIKHVGGELGGTTFINFSQDKIEDGLEIRVQAGSIKPDDKLNDRNEAVELAKIGGRIDPLSFFEKWHADKPREKARRLFYFLFMPDKYAQEFLGEGGSGGDKDAMNTIQQINSGQNVPPKQNPSKEYLAYYNQYIQSPAFKQLDPEIQKLHIEHIRGTIESARSGLQGGDGQSPEAQGPEAPAPEQGMGSRIASFFKR